MLFRNNKNISYIEIQTTNTFQNKAHTGKTGSIIFEMFFFKF